MQLLVRFSLILLIIFFFVSCNLIIGNPSSRVNPNDPEAQVTDFYAFPVADDTVLTTWQWNDWYNGSDEERIEEIRILHSNTNYPQVLLPFAGESFTNSSISQFEWKDLKKDTTHYFALHMKDERNRWYAPLYAKATLPGIPESGVIYPREEAFSIDNAGVTIWNPDPTMTIASWQWAVLFIDLPRDALIVNAAINISVTALTEITFAALDGSLPPDDWEKWDWLQNNSIVDEASAVTFNSSLSSYDITEVVRTAAFGPEKAILIKTTDASNFTLDNNASAPFIIADIIR